jgi:uncharacterized protein DUF397
VRWHKSSYSTGDDGGSVEVANADYGLRPVRGSTDPDGPGLVFTAEAWGAFVAAVKAGEFPETSPAGREHAA